MRRRIPSPFTCLAATLIVTLTVLAFAAWLPYRQEQAAIAELQSRFAGSRGYVWIGYRPMGPPWLHQKLGERFSEIFRRVTDVSLHVTAPQPLPSELPLGEFAHLERLNLFGAWVVPEVTGLPHLRAVRMEGKSGGHRAPAGVLRLRNLPSLRTAIIVGVPVREFDIGLLPELRLLHVKTAMFDDDSLNAPLELPQLRELSFATSSITDRTLGKLKGLLSLEVLDLRWTQVTDEGVDALRAVLPLREIDR